jgi:hypothetical protein
MSAFAYLPAGASAPRVLDAKTGRLVGLHVAALDTADQYGVLFKQHTGRGQPERPLQLARVARDRHVLACRWRAPASAVEAARRARNAAAGIAA